MKKLYSIAICPPIYIIEQIRDMKNLLATKIKWYHSKNAAAHITFHNLLLDENELVILESFINNFCRTIYPFALSFTGFGSFPNGAFFLSPDEISSQILVEVMKKFLNDISLNVKQDSIVPHISIGRNLNPDQLAIAKELFSDQKVDINFLCEGLSIRRFNEQIKQYEIYKHFAFTKD